MLGTPCSESTRYGMDYTVTPTPGADLGQQLSAALQNVHGEYRAAVSTELGDSEEDAIPADPNVKNYSYTIVDGKIYYRENSVMVRPALNATARERVRGMVKLRDCVRELITQGGQSRSLPEGTEPIAVPLEIEAVIEAAPGI